MSVTIPLVPLAKIIPNPSILVPPLKAVIEAGVGALVKINEEEAGVEIGVGVGVGIGIGLESELAQEQKRE